ncbi:MAG: prenyltransferase [Deltaproteobacteria bacterium]|jgi:1,4-dihydroxy-2-naphthoate octaprenyltransferase|nr:prenyltransferase [Deltaproteobacteria bacterium]
MQNLKKLFHSQKSLQWSRADIARAWWKALRPPFYIVTLIPLLLGYILAGKDTGQYNNFIFSGVLLVSFALHLAANLANDLFDYLQGTDNAETIGGSGALVSGKISPRELSCVLILLYTLVLILTFVGFQITGLKLLWLITLFAGLSSFFYVAPPIKYGYRALGELLVFLNMGLVMVVGCYYCLTGGFSARVLALALPVGFMVAGILYFQSLPEIETDKAAGKLTLVGLLGPVRAVFLFYLWWPVIWLLLLTLWLSGACSWPVLPAIFLCLPLHLRVCSLVCKVASDNHSGNWLSLDAHGKFVRIMYLICGICLILATALL